MTTAAITTRAAFLVASDPTDMTTLLDRADSVGSTTHVVTVETPSQT